MQDINCNDVKVVLDKWKHLQTVEGIIFDYKIKKSKKKLRLFTQKA